MRRLETMIAPLGLSATLRQPDEAKGLIVFAHGSGSSRLSPRNVAVAEVLGERGFATLLFDLLTEVEEGDRRNVFDIPLLADRLLDAVRWIEGESGLSELPLGLFGASTGAAAALVAAARLGTRIAAVVSRGGRADLAGDFLRDVTAPTLLIVGEADREVLKLNEDAFAQLRCKKALRIVPGATHLFPEPGALETAIEFTAQWFGEHLAGVTEAD